MNYRQCAAYARIAMLLLFLGFACPSFLRAQAEGTGSLRGTVLDPSGGAVPNVSVKATSDADQTASSSTTNATGAYNFSNLSVGAYTIEVSAPGFEPFKKEDVAVIANRTQQVDIALQIQQQKEQVTVAGEALSVDTSPSNNASAVVLSGQQLDALPDDPDELQQDLEALAGPSAGPNGGQMYIDGFTAGQLPPKSSIREIRINQNPFSSEYDKVGYGRIEIFTKPGTNQWHGQSSVNSTDDVFNARNPFITTSVPPYYSLEGNENVGGPLGKNGSIFFNADYRNIDDQSVISATTINPCVATMTCTGSSVLETPFSQTVVNLRRRLNIGPRLDYQLTKNNTISVRYQFFRDNQANDGIGAANLASQGYDVLNTENTLQIADTQLIGAKIVNETRFQYLGQQSTQSPLSTLPQVSVPNAFVIGGDSGGNSLDLQNHYEFQNYTSIALANHFIKFGGRLREVTDANNSPSGFNGAFTFPTLNAYLLTVQGLAAGQTIAQIQAANPGMLVGPSQFQYTAGLPTANVSMFDAGLYIEDDWRVRPNITLSYGLRFETQTHIHDAADWAPRVGIAWGVGGGGKTAPKTVLRAGWGIFYDRFGSGDILTAERFNGIVEQQYTFDSPGFFCANSISLASCPQIATAQSTAVPIVYQISPNMHAPYILQTALSVERQVTKIVNISVSYLNSLGYDQLLTNNINSPVLPGTQIPTSPANGGIYPNGTGCPASAAGKCAIYQFQSTGIFRQNQLVLNATIRAGTKLMLNAYYSLNFANSDATGGFPSDPYNLLADYGRASFDVRDRAFFGGTIALPWALRLSPFMVISSGRPYNITLSQDLIGSTVLNQRPGLVSNATCATTQISGAASNIYCTSFGTFNSQPTPGEPLVPFNSLTGPAQFTLNLRLAKTFSFGGKPGEGSVGRQGGPPGGGGGGPRGGGGGGGGRGLGGPGGPGGPLGGGGNNPAGRFNFTISANVRNIFNNVNLSTPIGNLTSPLFGQSNALSGGGGPGGGPGGNAANRAIYLQGTFAF